MSSEKPMGWRQGSAASGYVLAVLFVVGAVGLRLAFDPLLGAHSPYLPFVAAILLAGRLAGRGPALTATAFSGLSVWYVILEPRYSFRVSDPAALVGLGLFATLGVVISFLAPRSPEFVPSAGRRRLRSQKHEGIGPRFLRRIAVVVTAVAVLGVVASLLWAGVQRSAEADRWVEHTYQVLNAAQRVGTYVARAQTWERAYLLTGDERYAQAYRSLIEWEGQARGDLRRLTSDNRSQQARLDELERLAGARLASVQDAMELRK